MRRDGREQQLCFLQLHPAQEDTMSEMEMKTDVEVEDFTDDLSDEALDRAEGGFPHASATSYAVGCMS
jgi:hypothetical protein